MVEVTIERVVVHPLMGIAVLLKEKDRLLAAKATDRFLPIFIGPADADAIAVKLEGLTPPRPLTHDLLQSVMQMLGAKVDSIVVCDLRDNTFYAKLVLLRHTGELLEIDCRPSDGLALAVRTRAPIFVEDSIMEKVGIEIDPETGMEVPPGREKPSEKPDSVSEEELKRLSSFKEMIEGLDLDDFGNEQDNPSPEDT